MSKIDEIALKHILSGKRLDSQMYDVNSVKNAMIEYAELYTKKCLEIAANSANIRKEFTLGFGDANVYFVSETEENGYIMFVNKESILNIKLPEHE